MTYLMDKIDQSNAWFTGVALIGIFAIVVLAVLASYLDHRKVVKEINRHLQVIEGGYLYESPEHSTARHKVGHLAATNPRAARGYDLRVGVRQANEVADPNPYDIRKHD